MTGSKTFLVRILPAVLMLLYAGLRPDRSFAQTPKTTEGYWSGTVTMPTGSWNILVWLNRNPAGAWGGTLDSPSQGMTDFPLVVKGDGRSTTFRFPGSDASPTFKGTLSADGNKITGNFVQDNSSAPFELTRQPGPPKLPAPSSDPRALAHARRVLDLLRREKFADVVKDFDAPMTASMPAGTLSQTWSMLRKQYGAYKSELSPTAQQIGTYTVVTLGCQFEREALNMVVVFESNDKVSSLQFAPRPAAARAVPLQQPAQAPRKE